MVALDQIGIKKDTSVSRVEDSREGYKTGKATFAAIVNS